MMRRMYLQLSTHLNVKGFRDLVPISFLLIKVRESTGKVQCDFMLISSVFARRVSHSELLLIMSMRSFMTGFVH